MKKTKAVALKVAVLKPVYEYRSVCCGVAANKKPLVRPEEKPKSPELGPGLGKFRCTTCKKVAKVDRRKPEPVKE
jgi:hypothetical protein